MPVSSDRSDLCPIFRRVLDEGRGAHLQLLRTLCAVHCGTEMTAGVNEVASILTAHLAGLGLRAEGRPAEGYGDHLVASTGLPGRQIVLGGHMDTTYTDYSRLPKFRVEGDFAVGPGVLDMKGGIVAILMALNGLKAAGRLGALPVTLILNSDEERGSPTSRRLFGELIPRAKAALYAESGGPRGALIIARRGKISFRLEARGAAMHAGEGTGPKRSALLAIAHKIIAMEAMNARFPGTVVNVGRMWGGVASNTVPDSATALMDIRHPLAKMEPEIRAAVAEACSVEHAPGVTCTATETSYRPVWDRPEVSRPLAAMAVRIMGEGHPEVVEAPRGGTADSNWFGAAEVPTLDGLGPAGSGEHTADERMNIPSLFERAELLASLMLDVERQIPG